MLSLKGRGKILSVREMISGEIHKTLLNGRKCVKRSKLLIFNRLFRGHASGMMIPEGSSPEMKTTVIEGFTEFFHVRKRIYSRFAGT
jgi:hypothetical protein